MLGRGFTCVSVLDISYAALARARRRLANRSHLVNWIEADVLSEWSAPPLALWHDRAVFHFLTETDDRRRYLDRLHETLQPGRTVIVATFADDGPMVCSGLPTCRYSVRSLAAERYFRGFPNEHLTCDFLPTAMAPGGSAPPITLTVLPCCVGTVTKTVSVSGGATASDPTIVVAAVPALPQWAAIALTICLAVAGVAALRRWTT